MKKAFTLVELLVVISIMAILTIVTVSQFRTARKRANDVARKGDLNSVAKALQLYFADYGVLPESENGKIKIGASPIDWGGEFKDSTGYVYMVKLPKENTTGDWPQYCYKTDSTRKKYALLAKLEVQSDSECENNEFDCGIVENEYCYANVSPNVSVTPDGTFWAEIGARPTSIPTPTSSADFGLPTSTPIPTKIIDPTPTSAPTFVPGEPTIRPLPSPTGYSIDPVIPPLEDM